MWNEDSFEQMICECLEFAHRQNCDLIEEWCKEAGVKEPVGYYNDCHSITIYTNKPGYLIGKGGFLINKYQEKFQKEYPYHKFEIKLVEIKGGFANVK